MTWKSKTSGPVHRLWAPVETAERGPALLQGPWALQQRPRFAPTTQEIPVLSGAMSAGVRDKVEGLMQQMRFDLSRGHHLEAEPLLRERLKACRLTLGDAEIVRLAESLRDVDGARRLREQREARERRESRDAGGVPAA